MLKTPPRPLGARKIPIVEKPDQRERIVEERNQKWVGFWVAWIDLGLPKQRLQAKQVISGFVPVSAHSHPTAHLNPMFHEAAKLVVEFGYFLFGPNNRCGSIIQKLVHPLASIIKGIEIPVVKLEVAMFACMCPWSKSSVSTGRIIRRRLVGNRNYMVKHAGRIAAVNTRKLIANNEMRQRCWNHNLFYRKPLRDSTQNIC